MGKVTERKGLEQVLLRHQFYQEGYHSVVFGMMVLLVINFVLILAIVYKFLHPQHPVYFGTSADYHIIMTYPLTDPTKSDDVVLQWSANAVRKAFSLDYQHYREQLQDALNRYFTADGRNGFIDSLKQTNNLNTLDKLKLVSDVQLVAAPKVIKKGLVSGRFAWLINMPLLWTFTGSKSISMPMNVTLVVIRVPETANPDGIAINNFIGQTDS